MICVRDCSENPFLRDEKKIAAESPAAGNAQNNCRILELRNFRIILNPSFYNSTNLT